MLTQNVEEEQAGHALPDASMGGRGRTRPAVRQVLSIIALLAVFLLVLVARGWRPDSEDGANAATSAATHVAIPISPEIEATYGIRFLGVDVTSGGGMIQLRYQILDKDKTEAIHEQDSAPYVIDSHGVTYADPGIPGHSHVDKNKVAGTSDYILLANAKGGVTAGSRVTIKVGALELRNVPVG
jgi:hypothetical protein